MKNITLLIFIAITHLIVGCGGNAPDSGPDLTPNPTRKVIANIPDWVMNTPINEGYRYASASATSQDFQVAVNKATLDAANQLAGQMESEMNAALERTREEVGLGSESKFLDSFKQVQEQIISKSLEDYDVVKKEVLEERSNNEYIYRAYVLIEWDQTSAQKKLLNELKADELLHDQMRATELYDEMQKKVEAYRDRKSLKNN